MKNRRVRIGIGEAIEVLRHTLATQAINRGMRLEAIAALLGHRSMEMTLTYARIANRVVADEYAAVSEGPRAPSRLRDRRHGRLRREAHARMLANGLRTRPVELDGRMESACETCSFFSTGPTSCPSSSANETTPATTAKQNEPSSSTDSSHVSTSTALDKITRVTPDSSGVTR